MSCSLLMKSSKGNWETSLRSLNRSFLALVRTRVFNKKVPEQDQECKFPRVSSLEQSHHFSVSLRIYVCPLRLQFPAGSRLKTHNLPYVLLASQDVGLRADPCRFSTSYEPFADFSVTYPSKSYDPRSHGQGWTEQ